MGTNTLKLFIIANTLDVGENLVRLELSKPPRFDFSNSAEIFCALETYMPDKWALDDVWLPPIEIYAPKAKIESKDKNFRPDYLMRSGNFISKRLRDVLDNINVLVKYFDIEYIDCSENFVNKDYRMAIFPHASPFTEVFIDLADRYLLNGELHLHTNVRPSFRPPSPIFNVATGPWLMCTEQVVVEAMRHNVEGLMFIDPATGEFLMQGDQG